MGRAPCCDKAGLKKGPWTPEEDQKLVAYINTHGHGSWRALPKKAGLLRCGKSCRLRWTNYLRPDIKRGRFSPEEEQMIIHLHAIMGNRWSAIAGHLEGRTDNEIKNYWNTHLKKRLLQMGIDPVTHEPRMQQLKGEWFDPRLLLESKSLIAGNILPCSSSSPSSSSHLAQWENARLEAEARLARDYLRFQFHNTGDSSEAAQNLQEHQLWSHMMALNHSHTFHQQQPIDLATQLQQQQQQSLSPTSTLWTPEGSMSPTSSFPESEILIGGASERQITSEVYDPAGATSGLEEIQKDSFSVLEWADSGCDQSRDYWSNLLKLVGSC